MKIRINKIKLFGYHGVHEIEREKGQEFVISAQIETIDKEQHKDDIEDAVDYTNIIAIIKDVFNANRCKLIETLSVNISNKIMENNAIKSATISIKKISPPIDIDLDSVEVVYRNERK